MSIGNTNSLIIVKSLVFHTSPAHGGQFGFDMKLHSRVSRKTEFLL